MILKRIMCKVLNFMYAHYSFLECHSRFGAHKQVVAGSDVD